MGISGPCLGGLSRIEDPVAGAATEVGDAFRSVSLLLGGLEEGKEGKPSAASRASTIKAVLDFAEASQRFQSRAP